MAQVSQTAQSWVRYRPPGSLRPAIMLSAEAIRIRHGFRFTNISIGDVAGVGMLYFYDNPPHSYGYSYWRLYIWREDSTAVPTSFSSPVTVVDLLELEASPAGNVTRDITERVLAVQGPEGQLATRHLERHQRAEWQGWTQVTNYWGGDGTSGRCT